MSVEVVPGGQRRIDRVLDPGFVEGVEQLGRDGALLAGQDHRAGGGDPAQVGQADHTQLGMADHAAELAGPAAVGGVQVGPERRRRLGRAEVEAEAGQAALHLAEVVDPGDRLLARVAALVEVDVAREQAGLLGEHVVGELPAGRRQAPLDPDHLPQPGRGAGRPGRAQGAQGGRGGLADHVDPGGGAVDDQGRAGGRRPPGHPGRRHRQPGPGQSGVGARPEQAEPTRLGLADGHVVAEHEPLQPVGQGRRGRRVGVDQHPAVEHGQPDRVLDAALGRQQQRLGGVAGAEVGGVLGADRVQVAEHVRPGQAQGGQVGPLDRDHPVAGGGQAGVEVHGPMLGLRPQGRLRSGRRYG